MEPNTNKNTAWQIIPEVNQETKQAELNQTKMEVNLDLHHPKGKFIQIAATTTVILIIFGAFAFAPWDNPLKTFLADITEEDNTTLDDFFGEAEPETEKETTAEDSGQQSDDLAALFGEEETGTQTPKTDENTLDDLISTNGYGKEQINEIVALEEKDTILTELFPEEKQTEPSPETALEEPTPVDISPLPETKKEISTDYNVDTVTVTSTDENLENITQEPLPAATNMVTPITSTTQPAITSTINTSTETTSEPSLSNTTDTPFPINTHTVAALIEPGSKPLPPRAVGGPTQEETEELLLHKTAGDQITTPAKTKKTPDSGPENIIFLLLMLFSGIGAYKIVRKEALKN